MGSIEVDMGFHGETVTFLFTDIEGSTKLWESYPDAMSMALNRHDSLLRQTIEEHQGQVFKTVGDAFCSIFLDPVQAVLAACAAQKALSSEAWGESCTLRVRMALHSGTVERRGGDYFGPTLNRVARLLAIGHGGQILVSTATQQLLKGSLTKPLQLNDLGTHQLKDLERTEQVFQVVHASLKSDFPPLNSLSSLANNLPQQVTSFVGREAEIEELNRLFQTTRLLTLTGAGGSGKTRLALQLAADMLDEGTEGIWFVEFGNLMDPNLVPQGVASVLNLREEIGRPILNTLLEYLKNKNFILILDNCEHLLGACAELASRILQTSSKTRILATSREGLTIQGETAFRVPSLSMPTQKGDVPLDELIRYESVRLFLDRARAVQPQFEITNDNARAVQQICVRLDGIPLAIELAAARARSMSIEQIAQRLNDAFKILTGGNRTALPRQQTLRATIDWSYNLLSPKEKLLLQRLSVFAGGFTLEAAEKVCSNNDYNSGKI